MKIYYIPGKILKIVLATCFLIFLFLIGFAFIKNQGLFLASHINSPHYQGQSGQKLVSLTFNVDWGEEYLPSLFKILKDNDIKATFFLTGRWAKTHPDLAKEIIKNGHEIGNHGQAHRHVKNLTIGEIENEISAGETSILNATGHRASLYAPAFGEFDKEVGEAAANLNKEIIMWSLDTIDWQNPSASIIVNRVVPRIHNDAIVLMHPTRSTLEALPEIIGSLKKEGYRFDTVSNIIKSDEHGSKGKDTP